MRECWIETNGARQNLRIEYAEDLDPDLLDLLHKLLERDPEKRIIMQDIRVSVYKRYMVPGDVLIFLYYF